MRFSAATLLLILVGCAHPDITLLGKPRAPVPVEQVRIITDEKEACCYVTLGHAYAWSNVPVSRHKGYDRTVAQLRKKAASVGAAALWVPPPEHIDEPGIQALWMDRVEGWRRSVSGDEDYITPHELRGVLLVE